MFIIRLCLCGVAAALVVSASHAQAVTHASFNRDVFAANGFTFGDFGVAGAVTDLTTAIGIDINVDGDGSNGLFGGLGSDVSAAFDAATSQIEVTLTVDPLNVASDFRVVLTDNDTATTGDEFQFFFDLSGVTPGVSTTLTQSLSSPGPVFTQPQFGLQQGDLLQNYGLTQIGFQSAFGGTDRLNIILESIEIVEPGGPLASLTADTPGRFTFGTFDNGPGNEGTFDDTNGLLTINADSTVAGGVGFDPAQVDFDPTTHQLEVEARLLDANTAGSFNILMSDNDTDAALGSDDFLYVIDTSNFNTSEITTFTTPLGSGTESVIVETFGFEGNPGNGLQDFGLTRLQLQVNADDAGVLALEVMSVSIVPITDPELAGDYNGDGMVDSADYVVWRDTLGDTGAGLAADGNGDEVIDVADFDIWSDNFGASGPPAASALAAIPEPATVVLLAFCVAGTVRARHLAA